MALGGGNFANCQGFPFHRYFSRSVQVSALILLWPAFCWIGIRHLRELGIAPNARWRSDLLAGFLMALLPVVLMGMVYIHQGIWVIDGPVNLGRFLSIGASAAAVSLLEEFFFPWGDTGFVPDGDESLVGAVRFCRYFQRGSFCQNLEVRAG